MVICRRCKTACLGGDNYCHYCGAPLKLENLEMVRQAYENRRKQAVHNILSVLVKEGCINQEKLDELMQKLEKIYKKPEDKEPVEKLKGEPVSE